MQVLLIIHNNAETNYKASWTAHIFVIDIFIKNFKP